jgi:hypothetical protein
MSSTVAALPPSTGAGAELVVVGGSDAGIMAAHWAERIDPALEVIVVPPQAAAHAWTSWVDSGKDESTESEA